MLLDTPFDPLNSFRAPFLLKGPPNLLDYYQFKCRKSENLKIRQVPDCSGGYLIEIRHCLIDQATARLKSGHCSIDQAAG